MDTIPNISLTAGAWTNLYAESGIPVGTKLNVENLSESDVRLHAGTTAPVDNGDLSGFRRVRPGMQKENDETDTGAWAFTSGTNVSLNVAEA